MKLRCTTVAVALTLLGSACSSDTSTSDTSTSDTSTSDTSPGNTSPGHTFDTAANTVPDPTPTTTRLAAAQVKFDLLATVPGALDLAYRAGDDTLFVASRDGKISAIRNGKVATKPVLDISSIIVSGGEQGLLGLTFAVDGKRAYVDYTNTAGNTVVAEFAVGSDGVFDTSSQRQLLLINQPFGNHNGGSVNIGPDGYLYIGMGDGGAARDPNRRALDTSDLLGKILRIDPTPSATAPYTIPADNPFVGISNSRPEIWAIGVRNPWRFSFDRSSGDLWIADVGQESWEEIDVAWTDEGGGRGANFGWSAYEGTHRFNTDQSSETPPVAPIFEYEHGDAGCSISGGVRYRGESIASLRGWYVYGDYCSGQVRALQINDAGRPNNVAGLEVVLTSNLAGLSAITQGPDGELYALSVASGAVFALRAAAD